METADGSKVCQVTGGYGCGQVMVVTAGDGAVSPAPARVERSEGMSVSVRVPLHMLHW